MNGNGTKIIIALALVLLVSAALFMYGERRGSEETNESAAATSSAPFATSTPQESLGERGEVTVATYTLADVAKHDRRESCWTAVDGSVYDLTTWIARHPGGPEAILYICGTDGTKAFTEQHEGAPRPEQTLSSFRIGALVR